MTCVRWDRIIVVGGAGAVGSWLRRLVQQYADNVITLDRVPPDRGDHIQADVTALTQEATRALRSADVVVWALPGPVSHRTLPRLSSELHPESLVVQTLSVQSTIASALQGAKSQVLGINPLFSPTLEARGRSVAVVEIRVGPDCASFVATLSNAGLRTVRMTAEEHDRAMSIVQALTHAAIVAFGSVARDVDARRLLELATPPHRTLLRLLARIVRGAPDVYREIQLANPFALDARRALADAVSAIDPMGDGDAFVDDLAATRDWLGDAGEELAAECQRILSVIDG